MAKKVTEVRLSAVYDECVVNLIYSDNGIGIPQRDNDGYSRRDSGTTLVLGCS